MDFNLLGAPWPWPKPAQNSQSRWLPGYSSALLQGVLFPSREKEFEVLAACLRNIFLAGNVIGAGNVVGAVGLNAGNVKDWDDKRPAAGGTTTGKSCSENRLLESR